MDDVPLGLTGVTAYAVRAFVCLRQELDGIGIVVKAAKQWHCHPKGTPRRRRRVRFLKAWESASQTKKG